MTHDQRAESGSEFVMEARDVSKHYPLRQSLLNRLRGKPPRLVRAVDRVNLAIKPGEVVGLMGESGCGKTTLGKALCRLIDITSGDIFLHGQPLLQLKSEQLRKLRRQFQMLFQNPYSTLNPKMTVGQLLRETLEVNLQVEKSMQQEKIESVLQQVGLSRKLDAYPPELSGGERRRVGLARTLLLKPSLIVADEPVAGLDASIKAHIIDLMMETRTPDMAYLFISHDLPVIRYVSDRILVMFLGRIVEELPASSFEEELHHPYTHALLKASQQVSLRRSSQQKVDFEDLPSHKEASERGCPYANRCPWRGVHVSKELCSSKKPPLWEVAYQHRIACHRYVG